MVVVAIETSAENEKMVRGFSRFEKQMRDLRTPFKEIIKDFYKVEEENFKSEGTPEPFAPVSDKYSNWKEARFPGQTILRLHDNLFNALTGRTPNDSTKAKSDIIMTRRTLYLGVRSPYFLAQEKAGRKAIQLTKEIKNRWANIIHNWAYRKYRKEVLGE